MLTILAFLVLGIGIGFVGRQWRRFITLADRTTTWAVYLLVFLLGISVGLNRPVMMALDTLGLQALLLSAGAIVGSVLPSIFLYHWLFKTAASPSSSFVKPPVPLGTVSAHEE